MRSEDRTAQLLARALDPGVRTVSDDRIAALRAHVLAAPRRRPPVLRRVAVGFALVAALAGGLVVGHEPPSWLRDAAHRVGLPVDSSALVQARDELHRLGVALSKSNGSAAAVADRTMLGLVAKLDDEEKAEIVPVAHEVHLRAVALMRKQGVCPPVGECPPPAR